MRIISQDVVIIGEPEVKFLKNAFSRLKHFLRNNRWEILFFVGAFIATANVRLKLQYLTGLLQWVVF
jgi:hypothetical protein